MTLRKLKDAAIRVMRMEIIRGHARVELVHRRPYDFDERRGIYVLREESREVAEEPRRRWRDVIAEIIDGARMGRISEERAYNLILNAGRVQMHSQVYGTSGLLTNGFNYIAWTNDSGAPAAGDTTLASEIAANGLTRAQATTVTLPTGSGNQTVIDKTFTLTGTQSVQKTALFTAASVGVMNHEIQFTPRSLANTDTLQATWTNALG
jgi:hypothetical protein